jgi:predicted nucleic-acid-binding protein
MMRLTVDTNVLVRAVVADDATQSPVAARIMREADTLALTLSCLCELAWVLRRTYKFQRPEIASVLEALLEVGNVSTNRPAVEAGLATLKSGGDFADGVIAYEGAWLGGETFVSFDKKAVSLLAGRGLSAKLLA